MRYSPWYKVPDLSLVEAATVGLIAYCGLLLLYYSGLGDRIETYTANRIEFATREMLKQGPQLDPRLKIFVLDDPSTSKLARTDLAIQQWGVVLNALSASKPSQIIVDKVFGFPEAEQMAAFNTQMAQVTTPITAGLFASQNMINEREYLNSEHYSDKVDPDNSWPAENRYLYGPKAEILKNFTNLGHINYDGNGFIKPVIKLTEHHAVRHIALHAAAALRIEGNNIVIGDQRLPTDRFGRLPVNIRKPFFYVDRTYNFKGLVTNAEAGRPISVVKPGDVVVLLPSFYTGGTDFVETPVGSVPGGFIVTAVINSALTNDWISVSKSAPVALAVSVAMGVVTALYLSASIFWLTHLIVCSLITVVGLACFTYLHMRTPWAFSLFAFAMPSVALFAKRSWIAENKGRRLKTALEGMVSSEKLEKVLKNRKALDFKPRSATVTVMFVDIAGFSKTYDKEAPENAFKGLRQELADIANIVHSFGGMSDVNPNQGLFFYFGYNLLEEEQGDAQAHHADIALECAMELQHRQLKKFKALEGTEHFPNPLQIGINTTSVFVGDLQLSKNLEISIVGHGINDAKRMQELCGEFRIVIGPNTKSFLVKLGNRHRRFEKLSTFNQLSEAFEAYEMDPFVGELAEYRDQALAAFRKSTDIHRDDERKLVPENVVLEAVTSEGSARIVDYSKYGIGVLAPFYLPKGEETAIEIKTVPARLAERLEKIGIKELMCEVRWSYPEGKEYRHGLLIKDLTGKLRRVFEENIAQIIEEAANHRAA